MATYISTIGSGTINGAADYATCDSWFVNEKDSPSVGGSYVNGDVVIAKLQNADDGHTGTHVINFNRSTNTGYTWASVDMTVIVSGTNAEGLEWRDPSCTLTSRLYSTAVNSDKIYRFDNLDLTMNQYIGLGVNVTSATPPGDLSWQFNNCRLLMLSSTNNAILSNNHDNNCDSSVFTSAVNCNVSYSRAFFENRFDFGGNQPQTHTAIGTTFVGRYNSSDRELYWPPYGNDPVSGAFYLNMSGCMYDNIRSGAAIFQASNVGTHRCLASGAAVDCIFHHSTYQHPDWPNPETNVTKNVTFNYGTTPGEGEVSFSSAYDADQPNFVLFDHANNLAIGYVSSFTMPTIDLAGIDRGISPFDAGCFELVVDILEDIGSLPKAFNVGYRIDINYPVGAEKPGD